MSKFPAQMKMSTSQTSKDVMNSVPTQTMFPTLLVILKNGSKENILLRFTLKENVNMANICLFILYYVSFYHLYRFLKSFIHDKTHQCSAHSEIKIKLSSKTCIIYTCIMYTHSHVFMSNSLKSKDIHSMSSFEPWG